MQPAPRRIALLALITAVFLASAGCGNKGPLYLPEPPAEPQQLQATTGTSQTAK